LLTLCISPTGKFLAVGSRDGEILIWKVTENLKKKREMIR
jgi:hypothetical protein